MTDAEELALAYGQELRRIWDVLELIQQEHRKGHHQAAELATDLLMVMVDAMAQDLGVPF